MRWRAWCAAGQASALIARPGLRLGQQGSPMTSQIIPDAEETAAAEQDRVGLYPEPAIGIKRSLSLVDEVVARIREDITSLKIEPGSRMSVDSLAREFGVSQTPVREALSRLEALGLVTKKYLIGYCCAPKLTREKFNKLYEMRLLLEPYVAGLAAQNMSDASLDDLEAIANSMEPSRIGANHASYQYFADQDSVFHAALALGSGNEMAADALARLRTHLHIFRLRFHSEVTSEAFAEHQLILQVLRARSGKAAEGAMRDHIQRSYERLAQFTSE
jgi:DNA-binding GntR family transcriptional regulator